LGAHGDDRGLGYRMLSFSTVMGHHFVIQVGHSRKPWGEGVAWVIKKNWGWEHMAAMRGVTTPDLSSSTGTRRRGFVPASHHRKPWGGAIATARKVPALRGSGGVANVIGDGGPCRRSANAVSSNIAPC
jgi:hypothetical protein